MTKQTMGPVTPLTIEKFSSRREEMLWKGQNYDELEERLTVRNREFVSIMDERDRLREVNAELLAALEGIIGLAHSHVTRLERNYQSTEFSIGVSAARREVNDARDALAKAKGAA